MENRKANVRKKEWELVEKLQRGLATLSDQKKIYMMILAGYRSPKITNNLYSASELKQEYLIHSWSALYRAKEIGSPIVFASYRGKKAMLDYYRKVGSERLAFVCLSCRREYRYDSRRKACGLCNGSLESIQREESRYDMNSFAYKSQDNSIVSIKDKLIRIVMDSTLSDDCKDYGVSALESNSNFYEYGKSKGISMRVYMSFASRLNNYIRKNHKLTDLLV